MGYYQGEGIVSGGGSTPSSGGSFSLPRSGVRGFLKKLSTTTVTKYPGVSRKTAQDSTGSNNMKTRGAWEQVGTYFYDVLFPDCSGNMTGYSFNQIGDSNLYELVKTYTSVSVSVDYNIESL